jgi:hypothetical protein
MENSIISNFLLTNKFFFFLIVFLNYSFCQCEIKVVDFCGGLLRAEMLQFFMQRMCK